MQVKILKRPTEAEVDVTTSISSNIAQSSHKTLAEREEDYACAR